MLYSEDQTSIKKHGVKMLASNIYDELEPIESDFIYWQQHQDDAELAKDLADESEKLLFQVSNDLQINKTDRHKICCTLLTIHTTCVEFLSGINLSALALCMSNAN